MSYNTHVRYFQTSSFETPTTAPSQPPWWFKLAALSCAALVMMSFLALVCYFQPCSGLCSAIGVDKLPAEFRLPCQPSLVEFKEQQTSVLAETCPLQVTYGKLYYLNVTHSDVQGFVYSQSVSFQRLAVVRREDELQYFHIAKVDWGHIDVQRIYVFHCPANDHQSNKKYTYHDTISLKPVLIVIQNDEAKQA